MKRHPIHLGTLCCAAAALGMWAGSAAGQSGGSSGGSLGLLDDTFVTLGLADSQTEIDTEAFAGADDLTRSDPPDLGIDLQIELDLASDIDDPLITEGRGTLLPLGGPLGGSMFSGIARVDVATQTDDSGLFAVNAFSRSLAGDTHGTLAGWTSDEMIHAGRFEPTTGNGYRPVDPVPFAPADSVGVPIAFSDPSDGTIQLIAPTFQGFKLYSGDLNTGGTQLQQTTPLTQETDVVGVEVRLHPTGVVPGQGVAMQQFLEREIGGFPSFSSRVVFQPLFSDPGGPEEVIADLSLGQAVTSNVAALGRSDGVGQLELAVAWEQAPTSGGGSKLVLDVGGQTVEVTVNDDQIVIGSFVRILDDGDTIRIESLSLESPTLGGDRTLKRRTIRATEAFAPFVGSSTSVLPATDSLALVVEDEQTILSEGDTVLGQTVTNLSFGPQNPMNARGDFVFAADLDGKRHLIQVNVPEPTTAALLLPAVALLPCRRGVGRGCGDG